MKRLKAWRRRPAKWSFSVGWWSLAMLRQLRQISWGTNGYFGWGSHPRSSGLRFHIIWTLLFYDLFKPVNRSLSLLAAFVGLVVVCHSGRYEVSFPHPPAYLAKRALHDRVYGATSCSRWRFIFLKLNAYAFDVGTWCSSGLSSAS